MKKKHQNFAFCFLGRGLGLSDLLKENTVNYDIVNHLNSKEWLRKGFLQRLSISRKNEIRERKLMKKSFIEEMQGICKKIKDEDYLHLSDDLEKTIKDIKLSTDSGEILNNIPEIKNIVEELNCFSKQEKTPEEFCHFVNYIIDKIFDLKEEKNIPKSYFFQVKEIEKKLLDEMFPLHLFLKNNLKKFEKIKYNTSNSHQLDAAGYDKNGNKTDIEITTSDSEENRRALVWQREHSRCSPLLAIPEELAQCVESGVCCCVNEAIGMDVIEPRILSKKENFKNALNRKLEKQYKSKPLLIVHINFDTDFFFIQDNGPEGLRKEIIEMFQKTADEVLSSKKNTFKEICVVADDGKEGLAEYI